jgi:phosphoglycerate dehydrogenase-like enzyme
MFSSTLAEYCMMACSYFAKDLPRLMRQKNDVNWEQYPVLELRGSTLGIVGFGDIGKASAKLAKAYGMRVLGLKRNAASFSDPYCDHVYGTEELNNLMAESDYILISTPLTKQTRGMISAEALSHCKHSAVVINVGRGPIIDEDALIEALSTGKIKGAGLDVMTVEPLPKSSPLWKLDNVLLSPHNMDMTLTFMRESTEFFINENLPRFLRGKELLNLVDKTAGY